MTPALVAHEGTRIASSALILNKSTTHPNIMEDSFLNEIADAPGEIFDIPEDFDRSRFYEIDEIYSQSFESKLNSNFDF